MCGLCTKYKRLPLPIPVCLRRGLNLGLPISYCQLPLAASQRASEGGASEVGSQAFSDHSQLCNCDEAPPRSRLPAEWKQRSAFTPHSDPTGKQQAADLLLSLNAGFLQDWRGSALQVLGPLFTHHVLDLSSPLR